MTRYPNETYTQPLPAENGFYYRLHGEMSWLGPLSKLGRIKRLSATCIEATGRAVYLVYVLVRKRLIEPAFANQQEVRYQVESRMRIMNRKTNRVEHTVTRLNPIRARESKSDVWVPLQQAVITGGIAAAATLFVEFGVDRYIIPGMVPVDAYLYISGVIGLITTARVWFRRVDKLDDILYTIEEATGLDINQDGEVGIAPRRIPVTTAKGKSQLDAPNPLQQIRAAAWRRLAYLHLHQGVKLSRREIVNASKKQEGPTISQGDYSAMYEALNKAGMLKRGNLNNDGRKYLAQFLPAHVGIK